jgi:hypothetical protein
MREPRAGGGRALAALAVALVSAACARGPLPGQLAIGDRPPVPVTLYYESGVTGSTGKLWTTLPSGERFNGDYYLVPRNPQHQMTGVLAGPAGATMACTFRLLEPGVGPHGGGTYSCELSTGGVIQGRF